MHWITQKPKRPIRTNTAELLRTRHSEHLPRGRFSEDVSREGVGLEHVAGSARICPEPGPGAAVGSSGRFPRGRFSEDVSGEGAGLEHVAGSARICPEPGPGERLAGPFPHAPGVRMT